ncbi:unnamed protein product [Parnassius apollo]|uniref:(apollo) hypothetical protein n=1 Tax=Parnassius apollo TaxID=110799 RepID=A0A8S3XRV3_PARAO|nr:unnamed protein product [Parnassius apollo]
MRCWNVSITLILLQIPYNYRKEFPSDPIIADRWTEKIRRNRNDSSWKPTKNTKICSLHFEDEVKYITKGGLCRLRKGAVPTKDLPVFSTEEKSDDLSQEQNQPQPEASGCEMDKNVNLSASMTPLSSELDSIFDSPKKASLRRQLRKKILLQQKHSRKIKTLKQKNRRLKKRNATLKNILVELRKKRYINNDISNILSENVFAADLYKSLAKKNM